MKIKKNNKKTSTKNNKKTTRKHLQKIIKKQKEKESENNKSPNQNKIKIIVDQVADCGHILFQQDMYEQSLHG